MKRHLPLLFILITTLLLTVGCTIPRVRDTRAMPTPTESAQSTITETVAPVASHVLTTALSVEGMAEIASYRMTYSLYAEAPGATATEQITATYMKQPPAEQVMLYVNLGDHIGRSRSESIKVDGTRYDFDGENWAQVPDYEFWIAPSDMPDSFNFEVPLELVGIEIVNNRSAIHYRGEKEQPTFTGPPSDGMFDSRRYEWQQFDIWVDEIYNVVIRSSQQARKNDPPETLVQQLDYFDLNGDIQIVAPDISP